MDEIILDQPVIPQNKSAIKYGSFWQRVGAVCLDWIVMAPVSLGITYLNSTSWRSPIVLVLLSLIPLAYKPFMEFRYSATLGKMALKLRVRNLEFEEASVGEILIRNIFHIIPQVATLLLTLAMYNNSGIPSVSGPTDFASLTHPYFILQYITVGFAFITIIDAIVLAADQRKRSLHDRIGGTVVINQP